MIPMAIDTETLLIGKGQNIPPLVCAQFAVLAEDGTPFPWIYERADPEYAKNILEALGDPSYHWIFHNAAYDLSVIGLEIPEAIPLIWEALDSDRVHDTMIREMLYNLTATGDIDNIEVNGMKNRAEYSLAALTKKYTGIDRSAAKEGDDAVRTNYSEVIDMFQGDWPEEFVSYANDDPCDTLKVFLEQEIARDSLKDKIGYDPFVTECFRVKIHYALQLMTNRGNLLDRERVLEVTKEFDTLYNDPELVKPLVLSHFIEEYAKANGEGLTKQVMEDALEAYDDLPEKEQKKWIGTGMVIPAVPPMPYANGALVHTEECIYNKNGPNYIGKVKKDCGCPVRMKGGQKEKGSDKALHKYIWKAALGNECMEVWASDSLKKLLKEEGTFKEFVKAGKVIDQEAAQKAHLLAAMYAEDALNTALEQELATLTVRQLIQNPGDRQAVLDKVADAKKDAVGQILQTYGGRGLPAGWRVSVDKEWLASYALLDPVLEKLSIRRQYAKIITSYLPGLYWAEGMLNCPDILEGETDRLAGKQPSEIVHSCFRPLKRTGRTSSMASTNGKTGKAKVYTIPSMNGQQVDPRIRHCIVPREGFKLFSIDYSAMELGTAAQKCIDLFGFSVLGDQINAGNDVHAYLGSHIAQELDSDFNELVHGLDAMEMYEALQLMKKDDSTCDFKDFFKVWEATGHEGTPLYSDFYKHYRKFAKPTGLGYPGGLGPKTFVSYAKATYGVGVDLQTATDLRNIWKKTFPEMALYLDHVSKRCFDRNHVPETCEDEDGKKYRKKFYSYDTPLGLHRAKTDFCACANGQALQSSSAEGALLGVYEIQRECHGVPSILNGHVFPTIFVHDENVGEIRDDDMLTTRIEHMQGIMKDCMEIITPDVRAGTEACIMNRWSKSAFPYYVDGALRPYEEKLELDAKEKGDAK